MLTQRAASVNHAARTVVRCSAAETRQNLRLRPTAQQKAQRLLINASKRKEETDALSAAPARNAIQRRARHDVPAKMSPCAASPPDAPQSRIAKNYYALLIKQTR